MKRRIRSLVTMGPQHGGRPVAHARTLAPGDGRRLSISLAITIIALLFQSLITQSHIHPISLSGRTGETGVSTAPRIGHHAPTKPGDCAICREIAQAGHYVASALPSFDGRALQGFWRSPPVARPVTRHSVSHAWHSRGPPPAAPL